MIKSWLTPEPAILKKQDHSPTVTAAPSETPDYEEPRFEEPTNIPDPIATHEAPVDTQIKEHAVKPGESINKIVKDYYGDTSLVDKLCKYNNITNPNLIKVDQLIKIPPREVREHCNSKVNIKNTKARISYPGFISYLLVNYSVNIIPAGTYPSVYGLLQ